MCTTKLMVALFYAILHPIKTVTMTLFKTNPVYAAIAALLFLQIPILIAGSGTNEHVSRYNNSRLIDTEKFPEKSKMELILEQADSMYSAMNLTEVGLNEEAFELAFSGYFKLVEKGVVEKPGILTIADFSKSSSEKRLFIIDLEQMRLLFNTLVAHGRNSGLRYASVFSNKPESNKSSLGFYKTMHSYYGDHGLALKLMGLEKGINDKAYDRAIVMHGSDYVSGSFLRMQGYLGRSFGCPAIPMKETKPIINTIKEGTVLFIYHPTEQYRSQSAVLNS